jgi:lipoate-protein ligase A
MRRLALLHQDGPAGATLDLAIAHALLQRVSRGEAPSTLRLYRPAPTVAFGRLDALAPGFAAAAEAAPAHGFAPVLRGPGGHAAAYHEFSVVLDLVVADPDPVSGVQARFVDMGELLAGALRALGVDARVGEVAGEFCPGPHSVNAGGRTKLIGTAQRLVRGAYLLAASIVVRDPEPVRAVLTDVYAELALDWDPATAGAVADTVPDVTVDDVERALLAAFSARWELGPAASLDAVTLAAARERLERHAA